MKRDFLRNFYSSTKQSLSSCSSFNWRLNIWSKHNMPCIIISLSLGMVKLLLNYCLKVVDCRGFSLIYLYSWVSLIQFLDSLFAEMEPLVKEANINTHSKKHYYMILLINPPLLPLLSLCLISADMCSVYICAAALGLIFVTPDSS